jgi:CheY-like chemotaxis protein
MAALRAREITKQLLSFSRATDEKSVVLDLNTVIKEAGKLARCTMRQNVVLEIRPTEDAMPIRIDSTRACQALLNLCVNAQDAMPNGGKLSLTNAIVHITAAQASRHTLNVGEVFARCTVTDTGAGISPNLLPRIFQPFFTTKAAGKGTGLGLPIVQRVVQEAGGFVEVESVIGQGTTFHLYLPMAREHVTPQAGHPQKIMAQGRGRILVVDDVDLLRDFARNFLEMAGFTVLTANNGQEAVKILEKNGEPMDLILADYNMPGMNGIELLNQVTTRWPKTKFILASGFIDEKTQASVKDRNSSLILKPYAIHEVIKMIVERLAEK